MTNVRSLTVDSEVTKLIQVAKLYYEEDMNQSQIAKKLGVSRPLVSNMLAKARSMGIVEIKIKEPFSNNTLLLNQLKNVFNIQGGFVIPSANSPYLTEKAIINQSVVFLKEILPNVNCLGLGWGYAIGELIDAFGETDLGMTFEGRVGPLIGTATIPNKGYHPSELVREFGTKSGFDASFVFAPAFPTSEQEKELYINTDNYRALNDLWNELDTAILGVGAYPSVPDHATALRFGDLLGKNGAVGKILSYFYDKEGQIIKSDNDFALQIPLPLLGKVKRVIAICPPEINAKAVLGALKTGFITHVILTEEKAKEVINLRAL